MLCEVDPATRRAGRVIRYFDVIANPRLIDPSVISVKEVMRSRCLAVCRVVIPPSGQCTARKQ